MRHLLGIEEELYQRVRESTPCSTALCYTKFRALASRPTLTEGILCRLHMSDVSESIRKLSVAVAPGGHVDVVAAAFSRCILPRHEAAAFSRHAGVRYHRVSRRVIDNFVCSVPVLRARSRLLLRQQVLHWGSQLYVAPYSSLGTVLTSRLYSLQDENARDTTSYHCHH